MTIHKESPTQIKKDMKEQQSVPSFVPVETIQEMEKKLVPSIKKNDLYAPLEEAIKKYDVYLEDYAKLAKLKDLDIADYNNQIAEAKAGAKKALDERKTLETEITKIQQMKKIFSEQLV